MDLGLLFTSEESDGSLSLAILLVYLTAKWYWSVDGLLLSVLKFEGVLLKSAIRTKLRFETFDCLPLRDR